MLRWSVIVLMLAAAFPARARQAWIIDPTRTHIGFTITAIGYGETHGEFHTFDGKLTVDFDQPAKSEANFIVKAVSIDTKSRGLDAYIRTVFLDVDRFPEIRFASTKVEKIDGRTSRVTGDLTLLGITKATTFEVVVDQRPGTEGRRVLGFLARANIQRSNFGMIAGLPLVSDEVLITVSTEALST